MELSSRTIWLLIVSACCLVIMAGIYFSSDIKQLYYNNYREVGTNYPYQFPAFIKKDSTKNIKLEHININNLGDILCYCTYGKRRGLTIWQIKEFGAVPISKIKFIDSTVELEKHFVFREVKSMDIRFPCFALVMEPRLDTTLNLAIYVQDGKRDTSVVTPNYLYDYINFSSMRFFRNNKFNFLIAKYPSAGCDFMLCRYKGSMYLVYYYSLNYAPVDPFPVTRGELLRILNLRELE